MARRKVSWNSSTIEENSTYNQQDTLLTDLLPEPLPQVDNPALLDEQQFQEKILYTA